MRRELLAVAGPGVPIVAAWGVRALVVYGFLALLALLLVRGAATAGTLITDVSRSRFDDRRSGLRARSRRPTRPSA